MGNTDRVGDYRKATGGIARRRCRLGGKSLVDLAGVGRHPIRNKRRDATKLGRAEKKMKEEQRECLVELKPFPRRLQGRFSTEEIWGKDRKRIIRKVGCASGVW